MNYNAKNTHNINEYESAKADAYNGNGIEVTTKQLQIILSKYIDPEFANLSIEKIDKPEFHETIGPNDKQINATCDLEYHAIGGGFAIKHEDKLFILPLYDKNADKIDISEDLPIKTDVTNIMSELLKAGITPEQIDNYGVTLYVEKNEISEEVMKHYGSMSAVTTFKSNIDGKINYEIPFAYQPEWDRKVSTGKEETFPGLPRMCYTHHERTGQPIMLVRGERGFKDAPYITDVQAENKKLGVNKAQEIAMYNGSQYGWKGQLSNPEYHKTKTMPDKEFRELYDINKKNNLHGENVVLLAERYGDNKHIELAKSILFEHEKTGHLTPELKDKRDKLELLLREAFNRKPKFNVGDKVDFVNDYGVTFSDKTIKEVVIKAGEETRYHYEPTETPWYPTREKFLSTHYENPKLTKEETAAYVAFIEVMKRNYPDIKVEDVNKLCGIAYEMGKCNQNQSSENCIPTEKFNEITDRQEVQIESILKNLKPNSVPRLDYEPRGAAIKLQLPTGHYNTLGGFAVPEIPIQKLTLKQEATIAPVQEVSKKR